MAVLHHSNQDKNQILLIYGIFLVFSLAFSISADHFSSSMHTAPDRCTITESKVAAVRSSHVLCSIYKSSFCQPSVWTTLLMYLTSAAFLSSQNLKKKKNAHLS